MKSRAGPFALIGLALFSPARASSDFATAVAHFQARRYADAQPLFEAIALAEPANAQAAYYLGALALRRGSEAEGVRHLESATTLDAGSANAHNALGDAYGLAAQKADVFSKLTWAKKSLAAYQRAVALEPDTLAFHFSLLNFYAQAPTLAGGGMAKAYAEAEQIQKRNPLQGGLALCRLYGSENKWEQAFAIVDRLSQSDSECHELQFQIGRLAALSGQRLEQGAAALERYLKMPSSENEPSWANAYWRLGNIHEKRSAAAAARAAYEAALRLDPNLKGAREGLERVTPGK